MTFLEDESYNRFMGWVDVLVSVAMRLPWENIIAPPGEDKYFDRFEAKLKEMERDLRQRQVTRPAIKIDGQIQEAPPEPEPEPARAYSGTSQISAKGKACIPCGSDHFSTAAGELTESIRFAKTNGMTDPEVMSRITDAEDQLNAFERIDAAPERIKDLPEDEKELIDAMVETSRALRHRISDIKDAEDLEMVAAFAREKRVEFRGKLFRLQFGKLSEEQQEEFKKRAHTLVDKHIREVPSGE